MIFWRPRPSLKPDSDVPGSTLGLFVKTRIQNPPTQKMEWIRQGRGVRLVADWWCRRGDLNSHALADTSPSIRGGPLPYQGRSARRPVSRQCRDTVRHNRTPVATSLFHVVARRDLRQRPPPPHLPPVPPRRAAPDATGIRVGHGEVGALEAYRAAGADRLGRRCPLSGARHEHRRTHTSGGRLALPHGTRRKAGKDRLGVWRLGRHQPSDLELVHRLPMVPWRTIEDVDRMPLPWRYQRWTCGPQKVSGWLAVILATGGEVAGPILLHWGVGPRAGCVRISAGPATSVGRDDDRHPSHPRTGSLPSSQGPTGMRWPAPPLMRSASGVGPLRVVRPLCSFRIDWPYSSPMALGDHASRGAATFWRRRPSMYHPGVGAGPEILSRSRPPSPVSVPIQAAYSTRLPSASWRECLGLGTASLKRSPSSRERAGPWPTRNRPLVLTEGRRAVLAGLEHFGRAVARRLGPTHGLAPRLVVLPLKSVASSTRSRNANRSWSTDDDRRLVFQQRTGRTPALPLDPPGNGAGRFALLRYMSGSSSRPWGPPGGSVTP